MPSRGPSPESACGSRARGYPFLRFAKCKMAVAGCHFQEITPNLNHLLEYRDGPNQEWGCLVAPPLPDPFPQLFSPSTASSDPLARNEESVEIVKMQAGAELPDLLCPWQASKRESYAILVVVF